MGIQFSSVNVVTGTSQLINSNIGVNLNAIGYNTLDNLIYGIQYGTNNLVVMDSNGIIGNYGPVINLPVPAVGYEVGTIDTSGHLFIMEQNTNKYYVVDVNTSSPTFGQLLDPTAGYILDTAPYGTTLSSTVNITDWAISAVDGFLYGVTPAGTVVQVNQLTGAVTNLITSGVPAAALGYGPIYSYSDGVFYAQNNSTGNIYRITIAGNTATGILFSNNTATTNNDGASCVNAIIGLDFGDAPDISASSAPGDYKTLLQNNGPRHAILQTLTLGSTITSETDAYQNSTATGDDIPRGIQDDGPQTLPLVPIAYNANTYTFTMRVNNNTGTTANLYAWLDFNQNGIFETNEGFTTTVPSSPTTQNVLITFTKPNPAQTLIGRTFVRARLTTDTLINTGGAATEDTRSYGAASNGEVEDYILNITNAPLTCGSIVYRVSS